SQVLLNTLGLALESAARVTTEELPREALLAEATRIFEENLRRDAGNPYGYLGKAAVLRQRAERSGDIQERAVFQATILALLEDAYEATSQSPLIAGELSLQRDRFGRSGDAVEVLKAGLERDPTDERLRHLWIRLELDAGRVDEAKRLAEEGVRILPTSWRLQRHIARIKQLRGEAVEAVRGHYEAAIR